jgi:flagellar biosynthetic protein FlhB
MKQTEGDPLFKSRRRQRQYDIAMGTLKQVPDADLILTNPTHFAVAIRYRRDEAEAPMVLAKGVDFMAFRIRDIAKENNIIIMENPPLARALYFKSTVGQMIPPEFYAAVAEILAIVYRRRIF